MSLSLREAERSLNSLSTSSPARDETISPPPTQDDPARFPSIERGGSRSPARFHNSSPTSTVLTSTPLAHPASARRGVSLWCSHSPQMRQFFHAILTLSRIMFLILSLREAERSLNSLSTSSPARDETISPPPTQDDPARFPSIKRGGSRSPSRSHNSTPTATLLTSTPASHPASARRGALLPSPTCIPTRSNPLVSPFSYS